MRNILLPIFLVGFCSLSFSQDYYQIKSLGHNYSAQTIVNAFRSADFCGSHFESKRNKIVFDDGAIVELKSKVELLNEGVQILNSCVISDSINYQINTWSISSSEIILRGNELVKKTVPKGLIQQ
jgi:hypothetical protein